MVDKKLNFEEILEAFKKNNVNINDFAYADFDDDIVGPSKEVDSYGGEDCGSEWFTVRHFVDHDVYIRVDGLPSRCTDERSCTRPPPNRRTICAVNIGES